MRRKPYYTWLAGVALALVFYSGALYVDSLVFAVSLAALASVVAFGPLFRWGPKLSRWPKQSDERIELIHYQAGWYSYFLLLAWVLLYQVLGTASERVSETHPVYVLGMFAVIFTNFAILAWLKRRM